MGPGHQGDEGKAAGLYFSRVLTLLRVRQDGKHAAAKCRQESEVNRGQMEITPLHHCTQEEESRREDEGRKEEDSGRRSDAALAVQEKNGPKPLQKEPWDC